MQATGNKPSSRGSHCSPFRRQWVALPWEEASNNTNISGIDILYVVVHDTAVTTTVLVHIYAKKTIGNALRDTYRKRLSATAPCSDHMSS